MTLAIVAYPSLDETDRHWIESFRATHDPQSPRIDVHFGQSHHVFLVPAEGSVQITALHERLYAGVLKRRLRSDIPFVPHLTVGASPDSGTAERLAEELRAEARPVRGSVSRIDMVNVGTPRVETIASYVLRPLS
jgi:2'-5' RNA ligase